MTIKESANRLKIWLYHGTNGMTDERLGFVERWFYHEDRQAFENAIKALTILGLITERPCKVCEHKKVTGCNQFECVFDFLWGVTSE